MIRNYITIAMRNLMRQKLYASIHILVCRWALS
jgi:hypothetical protein